MKIGEAIKRVMKDTRTTQVRLIQLINMQAGETRIKTQSIVSERLKCKNLSVDTVIEMLDAMDYELVIQPKQRGKRKEGQYPIEGSWKE
ncbi:MAG: hypothetical protein ACI4I9_01645 [Porcipelethomonas sp.]